MTYPSMQDYFDKTVTELHKQGKAAYDDANGQCLYRFQDGPTMRKCAAGLHIPDELYTPAMEYKDVCALVIEHPKLREFFPEDLNLAAALQSIHDNKKAWSPDGGFSEIGKICINLLVDTFQLNTLTIRGIGL